MSMIAMGDILRYHANRKSPEAAALVYPHTTLSWGALDARSNRLARLYRARGVVKDDMVGIALENGTAYHEAAFAVWKLGATPATLSPRLPERELSSLLDLMQPRLIVRNSMEAGDAAARSIRGDVDTSSFDDTPF